MIIYEVNLKISKKIYNDFYIWLIPHQKKMLTFNGFKKSKIFNVESEIMNYKLLSVHYYLRDINLLNDYFTNDASKIQKEGMKLFGNHFSAERRILSTSD